MSKPKERTMQRVSPVVGDGLWCGILIVGAMSVCEVCGKLYFLLNSARDLKLLIKKVN